MATSKRLKSHTIMLDPSSWQLAEHRVTLPAAPWEAADYVLPPRRPRQPKTPKQRATPSATEVGPVEIFGVTYATVADAADSLQIQRQALLRIVCKGSLENYLQTLLVREAKRQRPPTVTKLKEAANARLR